jgi:hypothetical protein
MSFTIMIKLCITWSQYNNEVNNEWSNNANSIIVKILVELLIWLCTIFLLQWYIITYLFNRIKYCEGKMK